MIAIPHSRQVGSTRYAQRHLLSLNAKSIIASQNRVCQAVFCRPGISPPGGRGVTQGGLVPLEIAPASAGFVMSADMTAIGVPCMSARGGA